MTVTPLQRAALAAGFGVVGIGFYAARVPDGWQVAGAALLVAAAATSVGGLAGFLFGIPRRRTSAEETGGYEPNTNLEQISDWLTKILVGATLTQLGHVPGTAGRLFESLEPAFGNQTDSSAVAGATLVYFATLGFIAGWLLTRLYLADAMSDADANATRMLREASRAEQAGDTEKAKTLREQAIKYMELRQSLEPGARRTAAMQQMFDSISATAAQTPPEAGTVAATFRESEGGRIMALAQMHGCHDVAAAELIADAIVNSTSAFEQYQALVLARDLVREDPEQWTALVSAAARADVQGGQDRQLLKEQIAQLSR